MIDEKFCLFKIVVKMELLYPFWTMCVRMIWTKKRKVLHQVAPWTCRKGMFTLLFAYNIFWFREINFLFTYRHIDCTPQDFIMPGSSERYFFTLDVQSNWTHFKSAIRLLADLCYHFTWPMLNQTIRGINWHAWRSWQPQLGKCIVWIYCQYNLFSRKNFNLFFRLQESTTWL